VNHWVRVDIFEKGGFSLGRLRPQGNEPAYHVLYRYNLLHSFLVPAGQLYRKPEEHRGQTDLGKTLLSCHIPVYP